MTWGEQKMVLWREVYVAVLRNGESSFQACCAANKAVDEFVERFA